MEYLIAAVLLYFILQTASNLVLILRGESGRSASHPSRSPQHDWEGPSPRQETTRPSGDPTFWGKDIEDARWTDVNP